MAPEDMGIVSRPEGATTAFLLIHGLGAAPDEVATLGEYLRENDIASLAVRLAGHATSPEDLATITKEDLMNSVRAGLNEVRSWNPKHVFVAGLSMGGALTLNLAAEEGGIDGIVVLSPAVFIESILTKLLPLLKVFMKYRTVDLSEMPKMYDVMRTKYDREPLSFLQEFTKIARNVRKLLPEISLPILVIQSGEDKTINPDNGPRVFDAVGSSSKKLHIIQGAEHVLTCHPKRAEAYPLILEFVESLTN